MAMVSTMRCFAKNRLYLSSLSYFHLFPPLWRVAVIQVPVTGIAVVSAHVGVLTTLAVGSVIAVAAFRVALRVASHCSLFLDLLLVSRLRVCCSGVASVSALLNLAVAWRRVDGTSVWEKNCGLLLYPGIAHVYLIPFNFISMCLLCEAKLMSRPLFLPR
jgi:hypothetical protein